MMSFRRFAVSASLLAFAISTFAADLSLKSPDNTAVVSQLWENQKEFLQKSDIERRALVADPVYRDKIRHESGKGTRPRPVDFEWTHDGDKAAKFTLEISENREFSNALVIPAAQSPQEVTNFKIATKYYWKVIATGPEGQADSSEVRSFTTEDQAPRLLNVPDVTNFRDLGGRAGLNGRPVRQNLIFRSTAFNNNSKDGITQGSIRFTEDGKFFALNTLKIKTELDLRSKKEVADMAGSPLGDKVHWINISTIPYAGAHTDKGKDIFIREFRLFCDAGNYPIDFHCIAGSDRTGSLAFILEAALGISDRELVQDWEITIFDNGGKYFNHKDTFDHLTEGFQKLGNADESYATKVERYLLSGGITPGELDTFRSIMLESAAQVPSGGPSPNR